MNATIYKTHIIKDISMNAVVNWFKDGFKAVGLITLVIGTFYLFTWYGSVNEQLLTMKEHNIKIEQTLDKLDTKMDNLDSQMDIMNTRIDTLITSNAIRFTKLEMK